MKTSSAIKEETIFRVPGINAIFYSEDKAFEALENRLGSWLDAMERSLSSPIGPKTKLEIHKWFMENRTEMAKVLNF